MLASKMIHRLEYLISKHGDLDVNMLMGVVDENNNLRSEILTPIKQIKYRKKFNKFFTDFCGGF